MTTAETMTKVTTCGDCRTGSRCGARAITIQFRRAGAVSLCYDHDREFVVGCRPTEFDPSVEAWFVSAPAVRS